MGFHHSTHCPPLPPPTYFRCIFHYAPIFRPDILCCDFKNVSHQKVVIPIKNQFSIMNNWLVFKNRFFDPIIDFWSCMIISSFSYDRFSDFFFWQWKKTDFIVKILIWLISEDHRIIKNPWLQFNKKIHDRSLIKNRWPVVNKKSIIAQWVNWSFFADFSFDY